jgi:hypothetical protein
LRSDDQAHGLLARLYARCGLASWHSGRYLYAIQAAPSHRASSAADQLAKELPVSGEADMGTRQRHAILIDDMDRNLPLRFELSFHSHPLSDRCYAVNCALRNALSLAATQR